MNFNQNKINERLVNSINSGESHKSLVRRGFFGSLNYYYKYHAR